MPQSHDDDQIRAVTVEESRKMSEVFLQLANAMQIVSNSFQRQASHNLGLILSSNNKDSVPRINLQNLTAGVTSRIAQSTFVTYPCLQIRKILEDQKTPQYQINFATAFADTALGVPLEINGSLKTLRLLGVEVAKKDILPISARAFVPFFLRNQLSWCAINSVSKENIETKIVVGATAGVASNVLNNIGTKVMENTIGKTWEETCNAVMHEVKSNPEFLLKGWKARSVSIALSTILLNSQTTEFLAEKCQEILGYNTPSQSPKNPKSKKVAHESSIDGKGF